MGKSLLLNSYSRLLSTSTFQWRLGVRHVVLQNDKHLSIFLNLSIPWGQTQHLATTWNVHSVFLVKYKCGLTLPSSDNSFQLFCLSLEFPGCSPFQILSYSAFELRRVWLDTASCWGAVCFVIKYTCLSEWRHCLLYSFPQILPFLQNQVTSVKKEMSFHQASRRPCLRKE